MKRLASLGGLLLFVGSVTQAQTDAVSTPNKDNKDDLQEVVVTGTLIRGEGPTGSQLVTVDNAAVTASGTTNTADLLATVPALNSFNTAPQGGQAEFNSSGSSAPGLHGLPGTATLVLLDGHRLIGDTPLLTVPDPSSIPPAAIDHVEIVADGGSAIYGSDAVAGTINLIMKKNIDYAETSVSYGGANSYNTADIAQLFGKTWNSGSALFAATFENNSDLRNDQRSFYTQNLVPYGGQDLRTTFCSPPNVTIGATTYAAPNLYPGPASKCDPTAIQDLYSQNRRYAFIGNVRQDIGEITHLYADFKYTDDLQRELIPANNIAVTIPSTNPYFVTPPGAAGATSETADWNTSNLGAQTDVFRSKSGTAVIGASIDITKTWEITGDFDFGDSSSSTLNPGYNTNALTAAAESTNPATALDVFGDRTSPTVASSILNWPLYFNATQKLFDLNVKADGTIVSLPGGDMKIAIGGANRHEEYSGSDPIGIYGEPGYSNNVESASRVVNAAYGELSLPIVGSGNAMPGIQKLTLSVAGRYDHYSDFGSTKNPKYGISWTPYAGVTLRGSYGTSFHAPQLADLYGIDTRAGYIPAWTLVPPGSPPLDGVYIAGGRSNLLPETAKTASFGLDLAPEQVPGFKAAFTYFLIRFNNQIEIPPTTPELYLVPGLYDRFVTYAPAGLTQAQFNSIFNGIRLLGVLGDTPPPLVQEVVDLRRANIGITDIDGIDFDLHYSHEFDAGTLLAGISGEYFIEYETNQGPGSPTGNNLINGQSYFTGDTSAYNAIPWHVRATGGWKVGPFTSQLAINYTGHFYSGYVTTAGVGAIQAVSPFVTADFFAVYDVPVDQGFGKNLKVQLNVYNILDQNPPLMLQAGGYSTESANPLGRLIRLTLTKRW